MKSEMLSALLRHNPLQYNSRDDVENPHLFLLRTIIEPENFYFTCKHIFNVKLAFFQIVILQQLWRYKYPMLIGARGMSKSFLLALYAMLRATLNQGCKVVIVGSSFRPAKVVFEYCEKIWNNAPVLRDLIGQGSGIHHNPDKWYLNVGESQITALPMGVGGDKIRGQRANYTIADEFATIPLETFQNVVEGFGAVNLDPVESMYRDAERRAMKKAGAWTERMESEFGKISVGNQTIVSGTANYTFNHFYSYWRKYKAIIESGGDEKRLEEVFHGEIPEKFDYRDYCIIRIPYNLLPQAFMDEKHIARAKATQHVGSHDIEYNAIFSGDSQGFFRRSLIESCVTNTPLTIKSGRDVQFDADIYGNKSLSYILAFDTASEKDKFAIVILELHEDHRRIVYCWTTDRKSQIESVKDKSTIENNFYAYCARKIRNLMKVFNIIEITCDAQGGGIAVYEALHDKDKLEQGEIPIWEVIEDEKEKPFDDVDGLHILRMIQFANAKWVAEANHGMKKDFEEKILLFPMFDAIRLVEISVDDAPSQTHDTLENNYLEIEELKSELSTIIHSMTSVTGREHWDTPEIKQSGGRKGRMRKDRYSALLMANMSARTIALTPPEIPYRAVGGWAKDAGKMNPNAKMYRGPEWFTKPVGRMGPAYGRVIPRRK